MSHNSHVLGVFDSGLGGLTVIRELLELFPSIPIIYFGDTARFPYGNKEEETIQRYAIENSTFLIEKGATLIVVACNTVTSFALPLLQKSFSIPIFGVIHRAAEQVSRISRNKKVAVIGTVGTIRSGSYEKAIYAHDPSIEVFSQACPLLSPLIEEGSPSGAVTMAIVDAYLTPLIQKGIDTLVLGCTHYPLIRKELEAVCQEKIQIVDPAKSVAESLKEFIPSLPCPEGKKEILLQCYSSDNPERFQKSSERFLGIPINQVRLYPS